MIILTALSSDKCDDVCQSILDIFVYNREISSLLKYLFEQDIRNFQGTDKTVLFRTDSPATMIMSKYLNRVAFDYLSAVILPITQTLTKEYPEGIEVCFFFFLFCF